jgi:hypothetical protein
MRIVNTFAVLAVTVVALVTGAAGVAAGVTSQTEPQSCERGEFCLWPTESYVGDIHRIALENTNTGECVPLPEGLDARSFTNRTTRPVTVYQGRDCSTEAEFDTYPGGGTYVPEASYLVRGVQIWEH